MRYKGQLIEKPKAKIIPLLREPEIRITQNPDGTESREEIDCNIYIHANVILDFTEFEELCPAPEAPEIKQDGKAPVRNYNDPTFKLQIEDNNLKRLNWIFLKAIEDTPNLQWDTVKMDDPSTWDNFSTELRDAGFTPVQITSLIQQVYTLQAVDEAKVDEARKSFLASLARTAEK
jgi:hypothetical protein